MYKQKDEGIFQRNVKQTSVADERKEQKGLCELSDEQLELVRGSDGGGGLGTELLGGLAGKGGPFSMLGGL
jgi:hypothetical protein